LWPGISGEGDEEDGEEEASGLRRKDWDNQKDKGGTVRSAM